MDFDPSTKTHEELREFFKITKDEQPVADMNIKMFESTMGRMKKSQNTFYAFLNKQFNIMRNSMSSFKITPPPPHVNPILPPIEAGHGVL